MDATYPVGVVVAVPPIASRPTSASVAGRGIPLNQSEQRFTPRVALSYKIDDDRLVYASATTGFKSGGWNTRVTNVASVTIFGPEKATSYELGLRSQWLDRRLRANATVYHEQVEDLQLLSGSGTTFSTRNVGDLRATGLELELAAAVTERLDVFMSGSLADRKYENIAPSNGTGGVPCSTVPEPTNCTTVNDQPVRFPEKQATLGMTYRHPMPALGGSLTANAAVSYSGPYWTSTYNDTRTVTVVPFGEAVAINRPLSLVEDTVLVNLGLVFRTDDAHWEAALECSNCTEEYYPTSSLFSIGYMNDPKRTTLRLKYRF